MPRVNELLNPSWEAGLGRWTVTAPGGTVDIYNREQSPSTPQTGTWYGYARRTTAGQVSVFPTSFTDVVAGLPYAASVYVNRDGTGTIFLDIDWYNGTTYLSSSTGSVNPAAGVWARVSVVATAPTNATRARFFLRLPNMQAGFFFRLDAAIFEQSSTLLPYFDGDSPGAYWEGTTHDSKSREFQSTTLGAIAEGAVHTRPTSRKDRALMLVTGAEVVPRLTGTKTRPLAAAAVQEGATNARLSKSTSTTLGPVSERSDLYRLGVSWSWGLVAVAERASRHAPSFARTRLLGTIPVSEHPATLGQARTITLGPISSRSIVAALLTALNVEIGAVHEQSTGSRLGGAKTTTLGRITTGSTSAPVTGTKATTLSSITTRSAGVGMGRSKSRSIASVGESTHVGAIEGHKTSAVDAIEQVEVPAGLGAAKTSGIDTLSEGTTPAGLMQAKSFTLARLEVGQILHPLEEGDELGSVHAGQIVVGLAYFKTTTVGGVVGEQYREGLGRSKSFTLGVVVEGSAATGLDARKTQTIGTLDTAQRPEMDLVPVKSRTLHRIASESRCAGLSSLRVSSLGRITSEADTAGLDTGKTRSLVDVGNGSVVVGLDGTKTTVLGRITSRSTPAGPFLSDRFTTLARVVSGETVSRPRYRFQTGRKNKAYNEAMVPLRAYHENKRNRAYNDRSTRSRPTPSNERGTGNLVYNAERSGVVVYHT